MVERSPMPPKACGCEAVAYQEALKNDLEREFALRGLSTVVEPVRPGGNESKEMRIQSFQPIHQRGQFFIRPWMDELILEMRQFPFGKYKDIIDAISYTPKIAYTPMAQEVDSAAQVIRYLMDRGKTEAEAIDIIRGGVRPSTFAERPEYGTLDNLMKSIESKARNEFHIMGHQMKAFNFGGNVQ